jgi:hypothetical protein
MRPPHTAGVKPATDRARPFYFHVPENYQVSEEFLTTKKKPKKQEKQYRCAPLPERIAFVLTRYVAICMTVMAFIWRYA